MASNLPIETMKVGRNTHQRPESLYCYSFVVFLVLVSIQNALCFQCASLVPPSREMSSSCLHASSTSAISYETLNHVERVFCISDLHTDNTENMKWLRKKCVGDKKDPNGPGKNDLLVVAGDISHDMGIFQKTLRLLLALECQVLFVVGNHEAWLSPRSYKEHRSSFDKFQLVEQACRRLGVHTEATLVGLDNSHPLWVVPLQAWYDGSLSIPECEEFCDDFSTWPWTDFLRTRWPEDSFPPLDMNDENARIPLGLTDYFLEQNEEILDIVRQDTSAAGVMTVSHFLSNPQSLPDYKDLDSPTFLKDEWFDHGAAPTSAKFAKVAGSKSLDQQVRSLLNGSKRRLLHNFGHSHRPKDFEFDNVRYIHNPLGKPREREMLLISPQVDFQLVWDTRTGEVEGEEIVRYWEQYGGGADALKKRFREHKQKRKRWARQQLSSRR